jgi:RNA polymerase sigma factor (sigma-70 family)
MDAHALAITAALESSPDPVASGIGALFDRHHQRLFKLARRLSGNIDDAHDLVQETFLRVARSPGSIPHGLCNEEAWLVRVLINLCRDRWRQSGVRTRAMSSGHIGQQPTVHPESHQIARSLVRCRPGRQVGSALGVARAGRVWRAERECLEQRVGRQCQAETGTGKADANDQRPTTSLADTPRTIFGRTCRGAAAEGADLAAGA